MTRGFKVHETIEASPEAVWEVLTDWASRQATEHPAPREALITAFDPRRRLELTSTDNGVTAVYDYRLRQRRSGTEVSLEAHCRATGWRRVLDPLIAYMMRRVDAEQLVGLKHAVEMRVRPEEMQSVSAAHLAGTVSEAQHRAKRRGDRGR